MRGTAGDTLILLNHKMLHNTVVSCISHTAAGIHARQRLLVNCTTSARVLLRLPCAIPSMKRTVSVDGRYQNQLLAMKTAVLVDGPAAVLI